MARAKQKATTKDPVFAAIEKHKKAMRELSEVLLDLVPGTLSPDPKKADKYGDREIRATERLVSTVPITMHGLLALVTYVNSVGDGRSRRDGRHDNCFDESLYDVLAIAERFLAEQGGRAAA
ncbi:hypothetical protein MA20_13385 [Bradyrhizobium japonicum]|uniref:Uncharacterized protein n=1 Tax=Bradyrhizobium japonicum TaxID=375 RepID=A0A0A3Y1D4_BRAJP|nr:hypothetical protein [Bradyrhizobium japonicum]KGT79394.1 hypothetical protein MA20_13385 [Bradyrhizobium japonicum]MCS3896230.1 hypothetical protein [Bradyrhizobium japonicum USDA 38]MCS3948744.1 hypothetical protein [Bradyrhizobium japonicum]MCW2218524.1 hypothetical protein [Bradyrhizobium japonicum]MCW2343138.1 hypothetical protein [Bradyrhizobium japonicum]